MGSHGIRDRVAIVGMGCTPFGEHWDKSRRRPAGRRRRRRRSSSAGVAAGRRRRLLARHDGLGHVAASRCRRPLQLDDKPVTRVENMCATGSEAFRNACYAVASGAYDVAMAIGVEKLKDSGYSGPRRPPPPDDGTPARRSPPPAIVQPARPGLRQEVRRRRGRAEGRADPHRLEEPPERRAQPARPVPQGGVEGDHLRARRSWPGTLGIFDCSGVSDGSAAAIVVRAEDAHRYTDKPLYVKALSFVAGPAAGPDRPRLRLHDLPRGRARRPRTPTRRPASPTRGPSWPWPRCTTASRRPSSCSWRTSASPSAARLEGGAGRHLRPRRRPAGQPRRRPQELRPPDRRVAACA